MKRLIFLSIFLITAICSYAQFDITVSGVVTDNNGIGVPNVTVYIYTDSTAIGGGGYFNMVDTDVNGNYADAFTVPSNQSQGVVNAYTYCGNTVSAGLATWNPGNTDLTIDLDNCSPQAVCDVSIMMDSFPGSTILVLTADPTGEAPYTYTWNTGEITPTIDVSDSGTYCVTITDAVGCTASACVTLTFPGDCSVDVYATPATGLGAYPTGSGPFTYLWDTGETTQNIIPNAPGTYCVTVTDNVGCIAVGCSYFSGGGGIDSCSVYVELVQNGAWFNAVAGGTAPFTYEWNTGETTSSIPVPASGQGCVTMTDATGCVAYSCYTIVSNDCFVNIEYNAFLGGLSANGAGGVLPYTYLWNTGENTPTIQPTQDGEYCVTLTDADGCESSDCYTYIGDSTNCAVTINIIPAQGSSLTELVANPTGTAPFIYSWSTGETTPSIFVSLDSIYCVTIIDADGCEATSCVVVEAIEPISEIYGSVHLADSSGLNLAVGIVYLIVYDPTEETLTAIDQVAIQGNPNGYSSFEFSDLPDGEYMVKAALDVGTDGYEENLPTYHFSELFWDEANTITIPYTTPTYHNIHMIGGVNPGGPGFIGGYVSEGANFGSAADKGGPGEPVEGASVLLLDPSGSGVTHTATDAEGKFEFPDLAWGTYQVVVEIIGLDQGIKWVTIGPENPSVNDIQFEVGAKAVTTATYSILDEAGIMVSPNPVSDDLLVEIESQRKGSLQIEVYNATGNLIHLDPLDVLSGTYQQRIDFSNYNSGLYLIRITDGQSMRTYKVVKH